MDMERVVSAVQVIQSRSDKITQTHLVIIAVVVLIALFLFQHFGTSKLVTAAGLVRDQIFVGDTSTEYKSSGTIVDVKVDTCSNIIWICSTPYNGSSTIIGGNSMSFDFCTILHDPGVEQFSENTISLLGIDTEVFSDSLLGLDVRLLFTPASGASLARAAASREISLVNQIWVHYRNTQRPFYAILHRIDMGIVVDLEPLCSLQSLPGGDIGVLCDTVVEKVHELTGYDRVMVYKFHEDEHGEVLLEIRSWSDLEPYLGLHYPATDVPQVELC
ncbi:hypothetical protein IFM89_010540 [Coptis chinensis]|uniref:Phytochrome chromophore attachment site domain-containing protein n=1 Tax=Coptis chinensis TaxID=261450 RepID=A0A835IZH1_9MAGN|nr:hypothetical protein IFM89_010540 [Coptis chinensis]